MGIIEIMLSREILQKIRPNDKISAVELLTKNEATLRLWAKQLQTYALCDGCGSTGTKTIPACCCLFSPSRIPCRKCAGKGYQREVSCDLTVGNHSPISRQK